MTATGNVCAVCSKPAVVGFGSTPTWLCLTHFEDRMRDVKRILKRSQELLDETGRKSK